MVGLLIALVTPVMPRIFSISRADATAGDCPSADDAPVLDGSRYEISRSEQLEYVLSTPACLDESFVLTRDIDLGSDATHRWIPNGFYDSEGNPISGFTGSIDGRGHTISGVYVTDAVDGSGAGIFNTGPGANISDLEVEWDGADSNTPTGGLIGSAVGSLTISNVTLTSTNEISASGVLGGLIGSTQGIVGDDDVVIEDSNVEVDLLNMNRVGGLLGTLTNSTVSIKRTDVSGVIEATVALAGGLIGGYDVGEVEVIRSSFDGTVLSPDKAGGLVGSSAGSLSVEGTSVSGSVEVSGPVGTFVGGIVGVAIEVPTIDESSFHGEVSSLDGGYTGGLIGAVTGPGVSTITDSEVVASVSGQHIGVGGFIGWSNSVLGASISGSSFDGSVTGPQGTGGLIGMAGDDDPSDDDPDLLVEISDVEVDGDIGDADVGADIGGLIGTSTAPVRIDRADFRGTVEESAPDGDNDSSRIGGVIGGARANLSITHSSVSGEVSGPETRAVGGLVGQAWGSVEVTSSQIEADITGGLWTGGLVGRGLIDLNIESSQVSGEITGTHDVGGLIGDAPLEGESDGLVIDGGLFEGSVSGIDGVGGLVGYINDGFTTITDSAVDASVTASEYVAGGLVGTASPMYDLFPVDPYTVTVSGSSFEGEVSAVAIAGGLAGNTWGALNVSSTRVHAEVSVDEVAAGGLVGATGALVTERVAFEGTVSGGYDIGGLAGRIGARSTSAISETYARGSVTGTGWNTGGFVGFFKRHDLTGDLLMPPLTSTTFDILDSFFNGEISAPGWVGGLVGSYSNDMGDANPFTGEPILITRSYSAGTLTGTTGPSYFVGETFVGEGDVNFVASLCMGEFCPAGNRVTAVDLRSREFMENSLAWDFDSKWCYASGWNDDYPLLERITSGPPDNMSCWVYGQRPHRSHRSGTNRSLAPSVFAVFGNFLCTQCTDLWLVWQRPTDTSDASEFLTDSAGQRVCSTGVLSIGDWRVCLIQGLTPGREYKYSLRLKRGSRSSPTVSTSITLLGS